MHAHPKAYTADRTEKQERAEMERFLADIKLELETESLTTESEGSMDIQPPESAAKLTEEEVNAVVGLVDELTLSESVQVIASFAGVFNHSPVSAAHLLLKRCIPSTS